MKVIIVLVAFALFEVDAQDVKGSFACGGDTISLNCGAGEYLEIVGGNYGNTFHNMCSRSANNNCISASSLLHMKEKCNERESCTLWAHSKEMGDPCPYTDKFLEVYHRCVKRFECSLNEYKCKEKKCILKSKVCDGLKDCAGGEDEIGCSYVTNYACESTNLKIMCKPGEIIRVINAFWGRNDKVTCGNYETINCSGNKADEYIKNKCNFLQSCTVPATIDELGDPCFLVGKFLQVQYACWTVPRMLQYFSTGL